MDTSGFYKLDNGDLLHGPNYVLNTAYELRRENLAELTLPVDGWHWFESEGEARVALGLPVAAAQILPVASAIEQQLTSDSTLPAPGSALP
jgi:hypothetical protein